MNEEKSAEWALEGNAKQDWYKKLEAIPYIRNEDLEEWENWGYKVFNGGNGNND